MLPWVLLFPFWVLFSLVVPVLSSLHGLIKKDAGEMKVWLSYWVGYAILTFLTTHLPFLESIVQIPFAMVSAVLFDVYFECLILAVALLVNPKARQLDTVVAICEKQAEPLIKVLLAQVEQVGNKVTAQVQQLISKQRGE